MEPKALVTTYKKGYHLKKIFFGFLFFPFLLLFFFFFGNKIIIFDLNDKIMEKEPVRVLTPS